MKKTTALVAASLIVLGLASCNRNEYDMYTTVAGSVVEASSSNPVSGATVTISPSGKSSVTGSNGNFEFTNMDAQQYTITAQKDGYTANRTQVTGVAGETVTITIPLTLITE
ncbi:MAG: carboxypeptidase regulatory-like domain-containing protein [Bacteroidales bacterium]|nr:carboxypeptidase regulatory-like domain-containing protein [Bacteroidales bacterium]